MEFGDASKKEAPPAPPRNKDTKKFEDADCFDAPRDGEQWLIAKRIGDRHCQKIQHSTLHSSLLMEEGGTHVRQKHN